jgi:hypothetical protein
MSNIRGTGKFNDDAKNNGSVDVGEFNDNATNNGDVKSGAFGDNAVNNGNVSDTGVFNDDAKNQGTVKNGKFSPTTSNTGSVEDYSALAAAPVLVGGKWTHNGANVTGYYKIGKIVDGDIVDGDNVVTQAVDYGRYKWYLPGETTAVIADGFFSSGGYGFGLKVSSGTPWYRLEPIQDMGPNYYGYYPDLNNPHAPADGPFKWGYFTGGYRDTSYNNRTPQAIIDGNISSPRRPESDILRFVNVYYFYVLGEPFPANGGYTNGHYTGATLPPTLRLNAYMLQDLNVSNSETVPYAAIGSQINFPPVFGVYPNGDNSKAAEIANGAYTKGYIQDGIIDETYEDRTPQRILGMQNNTDCETSDSFYYGVYHNTSAIERCVGIHDWLYYSNGCFGGVPMWDNIEGHIYYRYELAQRVLSDGRIHQSTWESPDKPETFYYYSSADKGILEPGGINSPVESFKTINIPPTAISWTIDPTNPSDFTDVGTYYIVKSPPNRTIGTILWSAYEYATALNTDASYTLPEESYVQIGELGDAYWYDTANRPPIAATKTYIALGDALGSDGEYNFAYRSEWPPMGTHLWGPADYQYRLNT